jgi:hypothetical protein
VVLMLLVYAIANSKTVMPEPDGWMLWYGFLAVSAIPVSALIFAFAFEQRRWANSDYSPYATGGDD